MNNKHMNLHSTSLTISKMQDKTMVRYYYVLFRIRALPSSGDSTEQLGLSYVDGGISKWYGHFEKHFGNFFKVLHILAM